MMIPGLVNLLLTTRRKSGAIDVISLAIYEGSHAKLKSSNYVKKNCGSHDSSLAEKIVGEMLHGEKSSVNFQDDWIVDSGCGHHLTGDESKFTNLQPHKGNEAINCRQHRAQG
ncbi:uncharacterized protein M6B38_389250 [Iris pallida]|uniref:Uncharacterized protein n=1 Tax=Iris pallida TaxID=29817 RepID=A0AAX6G159_IRIPA|nr:uncharacterized protein M6B38_389250 [Iris pallida]